jgi:hypothetical protein
VKVCLLFQWLFLFWFVSLIYGNSQSVPLFLRMEIGRIVQRRVCESENRTCE